jgi:hypothetical protein
MAHGPALLAACRLYLPVHTRALATWACLCSFIVVFSVLLLLLYLQNKNKNAPQPQQTQTPAEAPSHKPFHFHLRVFMCYVACACSLHVRRQKPGFLMLAEAACCFVCPMMLIEKTRLPNFECVIH